MLCNNCAAKSPHATIKGDPECERTKTQHSQIDRLINLEKEVTDKPSANCCCCSVTESWGLFVILWTSAYQASLSFTISCSLLKFTFIESVVPSKHLVLCHPLLFLPSVSPSIGVFSFESGLYIRWLKYWSFSFSISPSNEYSGLLSFRMDCLDCLAVQGTLKSLLQHHSSKAPIRRCSAFFIIQLSHPYMTTGETIDENC